MEVVPFTPACSTLLSYKFPAGDAAVQISFAAVRYSRRKPIIRAALSKPAGYVDVLSSGEKPHEVTSLKSSPPPTADEALMRVSSSSLQCKSGYLVPNGNLAYGAVDGGASSAMEYLTKILSSKVYDVAHESPLQLADKLSERLGVNFWLKREDIQPVCEKLLLMRFVTCVKLLELCIDYSTDSLWTM